MHSLFYDKYIITITTILFYNSRPTILILKQNLKLQQTLQTREQSSEAESAKKANTAVSQIWHCGERCSLSKATKTTKEGV